MAKKESATPKDNREVRVMPTEFRVVRGKDGEPPKIEGYAAVFNSDSEDMGFVERIKPGAFKKALKRSDARALLNHDPNFVLGREKSGTLVLEERTKGLWMSVTPPETQLINDLVLAPIERGDIDQQSFTFSLTEQGQRWTDLDTDKPKRDIVEVNELFDVSPVTFPAYNETSVAVRSLNEAREAAAVEPNAENAGDGDGPAAGNDGDGDGSSALVVKTKSGMEYTFSSVDEYNEVAEKMKALVGAGGSDESQGGGSDEPSGEGVGNERNDLDDVTQKLLNLEVE